MPVKKFKNMFTRYDTIHKRYRQTDRPSVSRTPHDDRGRAMYSAVMGSNYFKNSLTKVVNYCVKSSYTTTRQSS